MQEPWAQCGSGEVGAGKAAKEGFFLGSTMKWRSWWLIAGLIGLLSNAIMSILLRSTTDVAFFSRRAGWLCAIFTL